MAAKAIDKEILFSEENNLRAKEFEQQMRDDEERAYARKEAAIKIFDPQKLIERADKIHEVNHPILGLVRYGELTYEDAFELDKLKGKSDKEKTEMIVYWMLKKAYPDIPRDFLKRMPLIEAAALLDFLTKQPAFLLPLKNSLNGSKIRRKHKT